MIVKLLCAAILGGLIGGAELVACYRDRPGQAVLSPSGLMYVFVNAVAALITLVATEATGFQFGLPDSAPAVSLYVVQVVTAGLGSAALMRTSVTLAQDRGVSMGPISLLHGVLKIVDAAMARKRALGRLSGNEMEGLSFARDHAALAQLACHALPRFDLAEAQRLGELAADLRARDDLTDADKLDCFGLELSWLVGERALAKAAARLRSRPAPGEQPRPHESQPQAQQKPQERQEQEEPHEEAQRLPGPQEWWRTEEQRRPAEPSAAQVPVAEPRVRGALARETRETRLAASGGRPGPAEEAGAASGKSDGANAARSMLDTRTDIRHPPEVAEPRPAGAPLARRSLRRSRTAS